MNKYALIATALLFFTQIAVWFQLNGQLVWKWFRDNPLFLSLLGVPISYLFILSTKYGYEGFGSIWAVRLIAFALGIISFAFLTYFFLGETLSPKTYICIILATLIMLIQLFM